MSLKSYRELITIPEFKDRLAYLETHSKPFDKTFGNERYLNQKLYRDSYWKKVRREVILRDTQDQRYCLDLAHPDYFIYDRIYVHHINPITLEDIYERHLCVYDPDNLVCCSFETHNAIHYGLMISKRCIEPIERKPNDTCPWR